MKKTLKITGVIILVLAVVILSFVGFVAIRGIPTYKTETVEFTVVSSPESIERGRKLAAILCASCHKNPETGKLTGTRMLDAPSEFGIIYSQNITQDKQYGIGNWTDGELVYLLRTGIRKDGKYTPPYMPKFPQMADEDINAILSFLRSSDETVTAAAVPDIPSKPTFLTKFLCMVAFKALPMPEKEIKLPDISQTIETGKYLAHNLDCYSCHSADFKKINVLQPELSEGYFGGGNKPLNKQGQVMVTPNLTPDNETGIGNWTEQKFIRAVKFAYKEGESALRYPMIPYAELSDEEVSAIFQYLKTIPPIKNRVQRSPFAE